jgi:hypothetical protein
MRRSPRTRPPDEATPPATDEPPATVFSIRFHKSAELWAMPVLSCAAGRWRRSNDEADLHIVAAEDGRWEARGVVVVADARPAPTSAEIVSALNRGAAAYVCNADPVLLLAHPDALRRRLEETTRPSFAVVVMTRQATDNDAERPERDRLRIMRTLAP